MTGELDKSLSLSLRNEANSVGADFAHFVRRVAGATTRKGVAGALILSAVLTACQDALAAKPIDGPTEEPPRATETMPPTPSTGSGQAETAKPTENPVPTEIRDLVAALPADLSLSVKTSQEGNFDLVSAPTGEEEKVLGQFKEGTEGWTLKIAPPQGDPIETALSAVTVDVENQRIRVEDPAYDVLNIQYTRENGWQRYLDMDKVQLLTDKDGNPVSTKIEDVWDRDKHYYYLYSFFLAPPEKSEVDGLWRIKVWNSAESTYKGYGSVSTLVLGSDKGIIATQRLPEYINTSTTYRSTRVSQLIESLKVGDQARVGIIAEFNLSADRISQITTNGFEYPVLLRGYEEINLGIIQNLQKGKVPSEGELRGVAEMRVGQE